MSQRIFLVCLVVFYFISINFSSAETTTNNTEITTSAVNSDLPNNKEKVEAHKNEDGTFTINGQIYELLPGPPPDIS